MKTKLNLRERKYGRCTVKVRYRIKICIFKSNVEFKQVCLQKQPSRGVLRKRCSENMQEIYGRTPMPKCGFNKVAKQLWNGCFSVPLCIPFSGNLMEAIVFITAVVFKYQLIAVSDIYVCADQVY